MRSKAAVAFALMVALRKRAKPSRLTSLVEPTGISPFVGAGIAGNLTLVVRNRTPRYREKSGRAFGTADGTVILSAERLKGGSNHALRARNSCIGVVVHSLRSPICKRRRACSARQAGGSRHVLRTARIDRQNHRFRSCTRSVARRSACRRTPRQAGPFRSLWLPR